MLLMLLLPPPPPTCASVAFWKASKIFFSATVSLVFLSIAFHTMPYACMGQPLSRVTMCMAATRALLHDSSLH